jgi:copper transport protein
VSRLRLRLALASLGIVALGIAFAAPASAHAELRATEPSGGATLDSSPAQVVLTFSEGVEVSLGSIRVLDADGKRVDAGRTPTHPAGKSSMVALALPRLPDGAYVVAWRVISSDAHPVHGAFTFRVGEDQGQGNGASADLTDALRPDGGSGVVAVAFGVARFAAFLGLLVLVGAVAFALLLWPDAFADRRFRRLVTAAWATALVATVAGIALQGPYGSALPLGDAFKPGVVRGVLDTRFGGVWAARVVMLVSAVPVLMLLRRRRARKVVVPVAAVLGLALLHTPGWSGHASTGDLASVALPVDVVHLAAASLWFGGLVVLTVCVLPAMNGGADPRVARFSRIAFGAVLVLAATGSFQAWRQIREVAALTDTTYGRLLTVKVVLFVVMVAVAGFSRAWVRRAVGPRLRLSVAGEVLIGVAVLAVTAGLVNAVPGHTALARPFSTELRAGEYFVDVTVDPAKAGPVAVHVYTLNRTGRVTEVEELTASLSLPSRSLGPLPVPLQRAGPGHFAAYGFDVPITGDWKLEVVVRLSDIDQVRASTNVRIR